MDVANLVGVAASTVAVAGAAYAVYVRARRTYEQTLGSRSHLTERLNRMACGVTEEYVRGLFGPPIFVRKLGAHLEAVYLTKHAWVRALYTEERAVLTFSVTVTDRRFRYLPTHTSSRRLMWPIGAGCFFGAHPQEDLVGRVATFGASGGAGYAEVMGGSHAVKDQYYVYGYCDSGLGTLAGGKLVAAGLHPVEEGTYAQFRGFLSSEVAERIQPFRLETAINSFAVAPSNLDLREISLFVDWDQVRVVPEQVRNQHSTALGTTVRRCVGRVGGEGRRQPSG